MPRAAVDPIRAAATKSLRQAAGRWLKAEVEAAGLTQAAVIIVGWALSAEDFVESHLYSSRPPRPAGEGRPDASLV